MSTPPQFRLPDPFTLILFGATGDLAARKIFPALWGLWRCKLLPERFAIVGVARKPKDHDVFREEVRAAFTRFRKDASHEELRPFLQHIYYQAADFTTPGSLQNLGAFVEKLEDASQLPGNRLSYLAVDPELFRQAVSGLADVGLTRPGADSAWSRVVIEKPFGHDLPSAIELDRFVAQHLAAEQIYRIDHYLGKETVQNLLAFRFGNSIFEQLFNRNFVDHVQITAAETVGMEGRRGAFYDGSGALRDVVQNHLLQLLALVAMEPPATLKARDVKDEKLQVLRNLRPMCREEVSRCVIRGQYGPGKVDGAAVVGYRQEQGVAADSSTETYVTLRAEVESWRWAGTPFLLRAGKRLAKRHTEIAVYFKLPPLKLFRTFECEGDVCNLGEARPNVLLFRIQPDEGISIHFGAKRPGIGLDLQRVRLNFDYGDSFQQPLPEAYETLLFDALRGDSTLFVRSDELEAAWEFVTPILDAWAVGPPPGFPNYAAGSTGPEETANLATGCNSDWRPLQ